MAAVAASDVAYTLQEGTQGYTHDSKYVATYKMVFGAALTYPAGGIPLTKAKLGIPNVIVDLQISDPGSGNGYVYKYNYTAGKIQIYQAGSTDVGAHTHNILVIGGSSTATANAVNFGVADSGLYKQLSVTGTILGAGSATLGGIVAATLGVVSAAGLSELGTAATVGATTLYARIVGW